MAETMRRLELGAMTALLHGSTGQLVAGVGGALLS